MLPGFSVGTREIEACGRLCPVLSKMYIARRKAGEMGWGRAEGAWFKKGVCACDSTLLESLSIVSSPVRKEEIYSS